MPRDLDISIDAKDTTVTLTSIGFRATDLRLAHQMVGELMYASTMQNFEDEVDPFGRPWAKNSPGVLAEKRRLGRILKVLQSTGVMKARTNYKVISNGVVLGNYDKKARKHQDGIDTTQRIFMGVGASDLEDIRYTYYNYIVNGGGNG